VVDVAVEAFAAVKRTKYRANVTFKPSKFFAFAIGNPSELCARSSSVCWTSCRSSNDPPPVLVARARRP